MTRIAPPHTEQVSMSMPKPGDIVTWRLPGGQPHIGLVTAQRAAPSQTAPIARRQADDYRNLLREKFVSEHDYLVRKQARVEQEDDLAVQQARVRELGVGVGEGRTRRLSLIAELEKTNVSAQVDVKKSAAQLEHELTKARTRERQHQWREAAAAAADELLEKVDLKFGSRVVKESALLCPASEHQQ